MKIFNNFKIFLALFFAAGAFAQTIWNGTANTDWYNGSQTEFTITTAEQLAGLAVLVNDENKFSGKTIKLGRDIMLNDTADWKNWKKTAPSNEWTPIGRGYGNNSSPNDFRGKFDGNGYVISGVYINHNNSKVGFFGEICDANIINVGVVASYVKGGDFIGGLAGYQTGTSAINNCYYVGEVVGGYQDVGGLVGTKNGSSVINNSYSVATVSGRIYVGGLVGDNTRSYIYNSYSRGSVSGDYYVGGLTGCNSEPRSTINFCYSTCSVSGDGEYYIGGLIGESKYDAKTNYCFYDKETSGQSDDEGKGTGKTTQEMKQKNTFADVYWDFENVWGIDPNINNGYPYLSTNLPNYEYDGNTAIAKTAAKNTAQSAGFAGIRNGQINLNLKAGTYTAQIYNLQGRLIKSVDINSDGVNAANLRIDNLSKGIFILNVKQAGVSVLKEKIAVK